MQDTVRIDYVYDAEDHLVQRTETWLRDNGSWANEFGRPWIYSANPDADNHQYVANYLFDGDRVWADLDKDGALKSRYVYDQSGSILARQDATSSAPSAYWYMTDRQGSVLSIFSEAGTSVKTLKYTSSSASVRVGSLNDRYEYSGRQRDPLTGMASSGGRWVDEFTGAFTSADPRGNSAGDINMYRDSGNKIPTLYNPLVKTETGNYLDDKVFSKVEDTASGVWSDAKMIGEYIASDPWGAAQNFDAGLKTGVKANVNAFGHTGQSLATLGQVDTHGGMWKPWDLLDVTDEDRANGYENSLMFARVGWELLALAGGGAAAEGAGLMAKAGRGLLWADTARNVVVGSEGAYDATQNGLTWKNSFQMLGFLGARGNLSMLNQAGKGGLIGRNVVAAEKFLVNNQATRAVGLGATNLFQAGGYALGRPLQWIDNLATSKFGSSLFGRSAHTLDGTRFESMSKRLTDWLHLQACFAAGTKLLARGSWGEGWRAIEEITCEDEVASRDELDRDGLSPAKF